MEPFKESEGAEICFLHDVFRILSYSVSTTAPDCTRRPGEGERFLQKLWCRFARSLRVDPFARYLSMSRATSVLSSAEDCVLFRMNRLDFPRRAKRARRRRDFTADTEILN